jgi:phosphonatase-like hydrolase
VSTSPALTPLQFAQNMCTVDLVVLDMAGTTVQDDGQVPDAFAAALASHGVHVSAADINRVRGASKRQAIRGLLEERRIPRARWNEVYRAFQENLERRYAENARPIPGAPESLAWLRAHGMRVALNTGFDRPTVDALLSELGWSRDLVDVVVCGDDVQEGRPAAALIAKCMELTGVTEPLRVANVGDTVLDLRAGHRAGVRFNIGVLSGAHNRAALEAEPHTHIIDSVADLPGVLRSIRPSSW